MSGKTTPVVKNLASRARAKHRLSSYLSPAGQPQELQARQTEAEPYLATTPNRNPKFIPRQSFTRLKKKEHSEHDNTGQEVVQYLQEMEGRVVSQMVAQMKAELARMVGVQATAALQAQDEARIQKALLDLPQLDAREWQNTQNAQARNHFMKTCDGLLTSHQVADLLGSQAKNRAASANHLKEKGKVLCLRLHAQDVYPLFQFNALAQKPYPEMAALIQLLQRDYEAGWQMALWFSSSNAWLDGETPLDVWHSDRQAVLAAAQAEMAAFDA